MQKSKEEVKRHQDELKQLEEQLEQDEAELEEDEKQLAKDRLAVEHGMSELKLSEELVSEVVEPVG